MSVSAFAAEGAPSTEKEPPAQTEVDATTRAADIPTESVALPYYATVVNLCEGCGTYTYCIAVHRIDIFEPYIQKPEREQELLYPYC